MAGQLTTPSKSGLDVAALSGQVHPGPVRSAAPPSLPSACIVGDAVEMVDRCIQHTPTLLELYTVQCKILKHAGDPQGAAAAADKARSMDLADRCLLLSRPPTHTYKHHVLIIEHLLFTV